MKKHTIGLWFFIAALAVNLVVGYRLHSEEAKKTGQDEVFKQIDVMMEVLQLIRKNYVDADNVTYRMLFEGAMKGMTNVLDPFSEYLEPRDFNTLQEETEGEFGGIGIEVDYDEDCIIVIAPMDGTPAERAGIQPGDKIYKVNGENISEIGQEGAIRKMRGQPGTKVKISYMRDGFDELKEIELTRAKIPIISVTDARIIPDTTIGFVRITQFMEKTPDELEAKLREMFADDKTTGLIIDLRNNPGGLVTAAVKICSMFLKPDTFVVSLEGRSDKHVEKTLRGYQFPNKPLILLVNEGSASAAEIMSGCLSTHKRAKLYGTKTYGKGSVQNVIDLNNGGALKLTIAHYYVQPDTVKDRKTIHKHGIVPDNVIKLAPKEVEDLKKFDDEWLAAREKEDLTEAERIKIDNDYRQKRKRFDVVLNAAVKALMEDAAQNKAE